MSPLYRLFLHCLLLLLLLLSLRSCLLRHRGWLCAARCWRVMGRVARAVEAWGRRSGRLRRAVGARIRLVVLRGVVGAKGKIGRRRSRGAGGEGGVVALLMMMMMSMML